LVIELKTKLEHYLVVFQFFLFFIAD
jgi:hypothetical protein